ncbi:MAG TPA: polysaccharide biosynthesis tyrosine autokinase [Flavobacterium sp.]|nr:polysaccharide biosynthesis tyrosine autokinase [Flavobacterium sp.]
MLDTKDFAFFENQNNFDFKGFLIKTASYWKWFLASLAIAFTIAHQVNIRKEKIYAMETTIAIKEESNPFFTSNTSLVFNWGGSSDQVQNIASTVKSRSHNEMVVAKLAYYIDYLKQGKYYTQDVYGEVPFYIVPDKKNGQLLDKLVTIKFVSPNEYVLKTSFEGESAAIIHYSDNTVSTVPVVKGDVAKRYKIGQQVKLPFLNFTLELKENPGLYINSEYLIRFRNFDDVVSRYQGVATEINEKAPSIIKLSLTGTNKARMVDYLNETVNTLIKTQLDRKNQFATNTIGFIDSTLAAMNNQLKLSEGEIKNFTKDKNIYDIEGGGGKFSTQLTEYDVAKDAITRKIVYLNSLKSYLERSVDYSKLPAPSVAGIDDPNIMVNVSKIVELSTRRSEMAYAVKSEKIFNDFDNQINALKKVLLSNIVTARASLDYDLNMANAKIAQIEGNISKLPEDQQQYMKIKRKYDLNESIINSFLAKRNEADIVKAANLSDIHFIDPAKDTGKGLVGPNTSVNYIMAFFLGFLIPLFFVFGIFFIENAILNTDDIMKLTKIPIIGVVGVKHTPSNLSVFEKPKSALAESFRAIRSSLQFLYKKQEFVGAKTLMLTSSISGEGKTFSTINIATVFAMSEKKSVIVGMDLRKPKIFDDFNIRNDIGVVNYLIGQKSLDEIIQQTHIPYLDVITSGPIPPNPSELLIGDSMKEFMEELKTKYDYVILDTPPVGLVSDAIELAQYADVTLYIMRQNYTKKDMITLLNNRNKRGELKNISIIFNGYENKAKYGSGYGYNYGYGYGYGYGNYSQGYHEEDEPRNIFVKIYRKFIRNNKGK